MGKSGVRRNVVLVHQTGVARRHQRAAILHVKLERVGFDSGEQAQRGRQHQLVGGKIVRRPRKIHRDVPVVQRAVKELYVVAQIEMRVGLSRQGERPVVVVAVKDASFGHDFGPLQHRRQPFDSSPIWLISW